MATLDANGRGEHQARSRGNFPEPELSRASPGTPSIRNLPDLGTLDREVAAFIETHARLQSARHANFVEQFPFGFGATPPKGSDYVPCDPFEVIPLLREEYRQGLAFKDIECGAGIAIACAQYVGFASPAGVTRSHAQAAAAKHLCELVAGHLDAIAGTVLHSPAGHSRREFLVGSPTEAPGPKSLYFYRIGTLGGDTERIDLLMAELSSAPAGSTLVVHKTFDSEIFGEIPDCLPEVLLRRFGPPIRSYEHPNDYTFTTVYDVSNATRAV